MPKRPWITPQQVRDYSETPEVLKRSDAKLSVDISRAEQYIITYTHNKGLEEMAELPEGVRTAWRRSEIGLRMAIGSSRGRLGESMYLEGLGLLAITVPILLVFVFNMAFLDKLDSYREPLSILRFLVTLSVSYLLMAGMICMGIWFPVRKAVKMAPAEALHYE